MFAIKFFNDFFEEVKRESNPKYIDPLNKSLYYTLENAMNVLDIYEKIHKKYSEKNKENYRQEMIRRKKIELENLEKRLEK